MNLNKRLIRHLCYNSHLILVVYFLFQFQVRVTDSYVNPKSDLAFVVVNVQRDNFAPNFVRKPYNAFVTWDAPVGQSIYRVEATDNDLQVRFILFSFSFFTIDSLSSILEFLILYLCVFYCQLLYFTINFTIKMHISNWFLKFCYKISILFFFL